jgi:hypothetical protein
MLWYFFPCFSSRYSVVQPSRPTPRFKSQSMEPPLVMTKSWLRSMPVDQWLPTLMLYVSLPHLHLHCSLPSFLELHRDLLWRDQHVRHLHWNHQSRHRPHWLGIRGKDLQSLLSFLRLAIPFLPRMELTIGLDATLGEPTGENMASSAL